MAKLPGAQRGETDNEVPLPFIGAPGTALEGKVEGGGAIFPLFGRESSGLPPEVLARHGERALCIPMPGGQARSLNLASAVAIALYGLKRPLVFPHAPLE